MSHIIGFTTQVVGPWVMTTFLLLAAESLLHEKRPDISAGLADVSRGRFLVPEIVPAALAGYGFAFVMLGAGFGVAALLHGFLGVPLPARLHVPWAFEIAAPVLGVVQVVPMMLMFASVALFFVALAIVSRRRWAIPIACVLTGVTYGLFRLVETSTPEARLALEGLAVAASAWLLYRHGFLAAAIGMLVMFGMPVAVDLVWAGGEAFFTAGLFGFVFLLLPAAAAVLAYRRRGLKPA